MYLNKNDDLFSPHDIMPTIRAAQWLGTVSLRQIADYLNQHGEAAPRGGTWSAAQVDRILSRA